MQKISALMDGELDHGGAHAAIAALKDGEARHAWETYHVIGDALRGTDCLSPEFAGRFKEQLAQEPTVLAPRKPLMQKVRAHALSAAASLAAVAAVGWMAFSGNSLRSPPVEVAAKPANVQIAQAPANARFDEYLVAHQEFSPSTQMRGVAPYIRTVSAPQEPAR